MTARTITLYLTVDAPQYTASQVADYVFDQIVDTQAFRVVGLTLPEEEEDNHRYQAFEPDGYCDICGRSPHAH